MTKPYEETGFELDITYDVSDINTSEDGKTVYITVREDYESPVVYKIDKAKAKKLLKKILE